MDDVLCLQPVALGDLCFAGAAAVQGAALGKQLRPCCPVNSPIHATAAQQAAVGCIHDAVTVQLGNVSLHDFQLVFDWFGTHGISSSKRTCINYTRKFVSCEYHTSSSAQGQAEHFQRCVDPLVARKKQAPASVQPLAGARLFLTASSSTDRAGCSRRRPPPAFRCPAQIPPWVPDRGRGSGTVHRFRSPQRATGCGAHPP